MKRYSFKITINNYKRINPTLQDTRAIYVSDICIVAKNAKFGGLYQSKYIKKTIGKYKRVCGSNQYPILKPLFNKVDIYVHQFPINPILQNDKENIIISNIKEYEAI